MHSANKCNVFGGSFNQKSLARTLTCDRCSSLKRPFFRLVSTEQYFTSSRVMNHMIAASGQPIHWLRSFYDLFFLWFRLCRGEAGLLVTPKYDYVRNLFPLVPVVGLFSPLLFLLCLSHQEAGTQAVHQMVGAQVLDQVAGALVLDKVAGAQVLDPVTGVQVLDQVAGAQLLDQVTGVQEVVDQVAGTQAVDQVAGSR